MHRQIFENRKDAAKALAKALDGLGLKDPVILGLPRGGTPLACDLARHFGVKADLLLVRKIGAPFNHELALGAIVEGNPPFMVLNKELIRVLKIDQNYLDSELKKQAEELLRRKQIFRGGREPASLKGRQVIVVDDGIATGASVRAALQAVRAQNPARLVLAVPVAPADLVHELQKEVDDFICLISPADFVAVGQFYRDFRQVADEEVQALMKSELA